MSRKITLNYSPISALFCWEVEIHDTLWLTPFLGVEAELLLAGDGEHGGEVGGRRGGGEAPSDLGTEVAVRQGRNLQQVSLYLFLDSYHCCDEMRYKDKARVCTVWSKEAFHCSRLGFAGEIKTPARGAWQPPPPPPPRQRARPAASLIHEFKPLISAICYSNVLVSVHAVFTPQHFE